MFGLGGLGKQVKTDRKLVRLSVSELKKLSKIWPPTPNSYTVLLDGC